MMFCAVANITKYNRILPICLLWTLAAAEPDFNPLPKVDEYIFLKVGNYSSGFIPGWRCESTVYRSRLTQVIAGPTGAVSFRDSNAARCTIFASSGQGLRDSSIFQISYFDTLSFWESSDSLFSSGFNRFLNVFVPANAHPVYQQGMTGNSYFANEQITAFPKREFQSHSALPTWSPDCNYLDLGQATPCKRMLVSDYRYKSENFIFLGDQGFFLMALGWSGAPLGSSPTGATKIQLVQRIQGKDTLNYVGTIQNVQVSIRRQSLRLEYRAINAGNLFDAIGRNWGSRKGLPNIKSTQVLIRQSNP
jgi:hypothetical protein